MTAETTPGRAAYEAGGLGPNDAPWSALTPRDRRVWEEAAAAAVKHVMDERDKARYELAGARELIRRFERITTAFTRGMYSARIDCWRGDAKSAAACLDEGLDGYDGPEWDGAETGAEWWERTKAEEGL